MNYSLIKQFKDFFRYGDETQLDKIASKFNEKYYYSLPRKFFFIKQYINVYSVSNSVVIDFPAGMSIPKDLVRFLSNKSFYYTVFFEHFNGKSQILITNIKKGGYVNG